MVGTNGILRLTKADKVNRIILERKYMKTIKYNNKEYKLPFEVELPEDPTAEVEVANRFSGQNFADTLHLNLVHLVLLIMMKTHKVIEQQLQLGK